VLETNSCYSVYRRRSAGVFLSFSRGDFRNRVAGNEDHEVVCPLSLVTGSGLPSRNSSSPLLCIRSLSKYSSNSMRWKHSIWRCPVPVTGESHDATDSARHRTDAGAPRMSAATILAFSDGGSSPSRGRRRIANPASPLLGTEWYDHGFVVTPCWRAAGTRVKSEPLLWVGSAHGIPTPPTRTPIGQPYTYKLLQAVLQAHRGQVLSRRAPPRTPLPLRLAEADRDQKVCRRASLPRSG